MPNFRYALILATSLAPLVLPVVASAQQAQGHALNRFNPAERGSEWFVADSLDLRGDRRFALGLTGEYGRLPLVVAMADGSQRLNVVQDQLTLHLGGSVVLVDRVRLGIDLPLTLAQQGSSGTVGPYAFKAPSGGGLGDIRLGGHAHLLGSVADGFALAGGMQLFLPMGAREEYLGDEIVRVQPRVLFAGERGPLAYAGHVGVMFRGIDDPTAGSPKGSEITYSAAVGVHALDRALLVGPELYGSTAVTDPFATATTPMEVVMGAHYTIEKEWRIGAGIGPGVLHKFGAPAWRAIVGVEWAPGVAPPKPAAAPVAPPPPPDRDHDGIPDASDACPDAAGPRTAETRTNGCPPPPPDRDHDGVPDAEDACPDTPGPISVDPTKRGCPADDDGDGVPDAEDACPKVPGPRGPDPKTSGCPADPDRDKDGVPNDVDACPDKPGPTDPDPTKSGCPRAQVVEGRIQIADQVKFGTGSAVILKESEPILGAVEKILKEHPEIKKVRVEGHTDNQGPAAYNKALSAQRAAAVVDWLVKRGIERGRLASAGLGQERPLDDNKTEPGRKNNRRVEFHIEP